jgi:hypothetical protein
LEKMDIIVLSLLNKVDKRNCHWRTKWQHRVEWLGLVENLNSCSWWEIEKDLGESFKFVIISTLNSFWRWEETHAMNYRRVLMEKDIDITLYFFLCFKFHIIWICFKIIANVILL